MEYTSLKGEPGSDVTITDLGLQTDFSIYLQIRQTWLAFSMRAQYTYIPIVCFYVFSVVADIFSIVVVL